MKLTQYLVRLNFEGLKEPTKNQLNMLDQVTKKKKEVKKVQLDPDHPDFDSEEEYGNEVKEYVSSSEEEDDEEEGESDQEDKEDGSELVSDDEEAGAEIKKPVPKPRKQVEYAVKKTPPNEYLVKREATLLAILKRSFKERVIIFANEKIQCTRLNALLTIFGLKCAEVHGNLK